MAKILGCHGIEGAYQDLANFALKNENLYWRFITEQDGQKLNIHAGLLDFLQPTSKFKHNLHCLVFVEQFGEEGFSYGALKYVNGKPYCDLNNSRSFNGSVTDIIINNATWDEVHNGTMERTKEHEELFQKFMQQQATMNDINEQIKIANLNGDKKLLQKLVAIKKDNNANRNTNIELA